jgi:hypothetical protein
MVTAAVYRRPVAESRIHAHIERFKRIAVLHIRLAIGKNSIGWSCIEGRDRINRDHLPRILVRLVN